MLNQIGLTHVYLNLCRIQAIYSYSLNNTRGGVGNGEKQKLCSRPEETPLFDSPIFCELKNVFRLKIEWKLAKGQGFFEISPPLKFYFSKIFKVIVESSQTSHSIGNFTLKNVITAHFLMKWTSEEICRHYLIFNDFVTSYMNDRYMT